MPFETEYIPATILGYDPLERRIYIAPNKWNLIVDKELSEVAFPEGLVNNRKQCICIVMTQFAQNIYLLYYRDP